MLALAAAIAALPAIAAAHRPIARAHRPVARAHRTAAQAPAPPGGLTATPGSGTVRLQWRASTGGSGVAGYYVWRRDNPGSNWLQIAQTQSLSYTDTTVTAGSGYAYAVRAYDSAGAVSGSSAVVPVAVPAGGGSGGGGSGSIVWKADASQPLQNQWGEISTQDQCGVVTAPGVSSARVSVLSGAGSPSPTRSFYRMSLLAGDNCWGARSELGQGNPVKWPGRLFYNGQDRWISWAMRLAPNFPTSTYAWQSVAQWKQTVGYPGGSGGSPILELDVFGGQWSIDHTSWDPTDQFNPAKGYHREWLGPALTGRWVKFTMHVLFSDNPGVGVFQLWGDIGDGRGWRVLVPFEHVATLKRDVGGTGLPVPSHSRLGVYRNPVYTASTFADYAGYTVATSRPAAQTSAFGRG